MKITAFCDIAPCSLGVDRRFITLIMEAVCTSETSVYSETTQRHILYLIFRNLQFAVYLPTLFSNLDYIASNERVVGEWYE
jgi:hypothetical protein